MVRVGEAKELRALPRDRSRRSATVSSQGLPGYTLERAPGGSWPSRLDAKRNVIVVNNGHRDFVYASRSKSLKPSQLERE